MEQPLSSKLPENMKRVVVQYDTETIDRHFSGEDVEKIKEKVEGSTNMQNLISQIERAEKYIEREKSLIEEGKGDSEYIERQEFEIKCLIRELKGEPIEGSTEEEKAEFRKFCPNVLTDEQVEALRKKTSKINVS